MASLPPSGTPSEFAESELPLTEGDEESPPPKPSYPPFAPYAKEPVPPSVAETIATGRDLRVKYKSTPKKSMRPLPRPARPRGPKATDVKMSSRQLRAHARCLRKHGAVLTDRLEFISKPTRRHIIYMWRDHADTLPSETIARFRSMLDADEPFKPEQAYEYFVNLRKTKKKAAAARGVKQIKKDLLTVCGDKKYAWARNATVSFAKGIQQRLSRPGRYALADGMLRLSDIILEEICNYMHVRMPSRRSSHPKAKFMMEMADKVAIWVDEILMESDDRMLMMDFDEDEDITGVDEFGDARFADDFLNMMAGSEQQKTAPKWGYQTFTGDMQDAFKILTDSMYKKGSQPLLKHGKFDQTYAEGADELRQAPDFNARSFDAALASKINDNLSATVGPTTPPKIAPHMKEMVQLCANYLAQNAKMNEHNGPAFKLLLQSMRSQPEKHLYSKGIAQRTYGQAATELENAKGLETDRDEPNLSQEIHSNLNRLVENATPPDLKTDMDEILDLSSKYLSERAVEENERGPAFAAMINELEKSGGKNFMSEYPGLATNRAAANALKTARTLTVRNPDLATAAKFKDALHKVVDASTPSDVKSDMNDAIDKSGDYLSTVARDRSGVGGEAGGPGGMGGGPGGAGGPGGVQGGPGGAGAGAGTTGGFGGPGGSQGGPGGAGAGAGTDGGVGGTGGVQGGPGGAGAGAETAGGVGVPGGVHGGPAGAGAGAGTAGSFGGPGGVQGGPGGAGAGTGTAGGFGGPGGAGAGAGIAGGFGGPGGAGAGAGTTGGVVGTGGVQGGPGGAGAGAGIAGGFGGPGGAGAGTGTTGGVGGPGGVHGGPGGAHAGAGSAGGVRGPGVGQGGPGGAGAGAGTAGGLGGPGGVQGGPGGAGEGAGKAGGVGGPVGVGAGAGTAGGFGAPGGVQGGSRGAGAGAGTAGGFGGPGGVQGGPEGAGARAGTAGGFGGPGGVQGGPGGAGGGAGIAGGVGGLGGAGGPGGVIGGGPGGVGRGPKGVGKPGGVGGGPGSGGGRPGGGQLGGAGGKTGSKEDRGTGGADQRRGTADLDYKARVREDLISEMQKRGNEIIIEVDGAAETSFFAAQRLKAAASLDVAEPSNKVAYHLKNQLHDIVRRRATPRNLIPTMKDHVKEASNYLSQHVTKPDETIEAYVSLLREMEAAGDDLLIEGNIPKSYKDCAAYLQQLTSSQDQINMSNSSMQSTVAGKLKGLMANVPSSGYKPATMDKVIADSTKHLVSYIMLQGEKTETLMVLISKMDEVSDKVLLRHGPIRKTFKEGADKLRGKNTDQLRVESADSVVVRKIQIKFDNLMDGFVPTKNTARMGQVIEEAINYLAVTLLEPQIIKVCKCMKSVYVQCELWCEEILRRVSRPCCTCARHGSPPAQAQLEPFHLMHGRPGTSRAFAPGLEIAVSDCPAQTTPSNSCPAVGRECNSMRPQRGDTTASFLLYSPTRLPPQTPEGHEPTRLNEQKSSDSIHDASINNEQDSSDSTHASFHTLLDTPISGESKKSPFWQSPTTMCVSLSTPVKMEEPQLDTVESSDDQVYFNARSDSHAPVVTTDQMSDWHAMMVSLMWNVQAWRDWLQENIDRAVVYKHRPNISQKEGEQYWASFQNRIAKEALQWRQYNRFSRQLTLRLALRYRDKQIVSPTRATVKTKAYMECQREMLNMISMFNRWTHWLVVIVKETESLKQTPGIDTPLHELRWNHFKRKVEEYSGDWRKYNMHLKICWEYKYRLIISDWLPGWKQPGPVWVVSACGAVPSGAVSAGKYEQEVTWVARTTHRCNVLPAALLPSKHCCLLYDDGKEHYCSKYQVLCNAAVRWEAWRAGREGARAVRVAPGVLVGRVHYRGSHLLGAVLAPNHRCHVVIFGRPCAFYCFELLVLDSNE